MFYWVYMYIILFVHHSHRLHLLYSYCHLFMLASMFMTHYTTVLVYLSVNVFVDNLCHTVCQSFLKYFSSVWHCQVSTILSVCHFLNISLLSGIVKYLSYCLSCFLNISLLSGIVKYLSYCLSHFLKVSLLSVIVKYLSYCLSHFLKVSLLSSIVKSLSYCLKHILHFSSVWH